MQNKSYAWKPIELWPDLWPSQGLEQVFPEFQAVAGKPVFDNLIQKTVREWSITTGQIEGAYEVERGVTQTMIQSGLVQNLIPQQRNGLSQEQVYQILVDHQDTLEGLFGVVPKFETRD